MPICGAVGGCMVHWACASWLYLPQNQWSNTMPSRARMTFSWKFGSGRLTVLCSVGRKLRNCSSKSESSGWRFRVWVDASSCGQSPDGGYTCVRAVTQCMLEQYKHDIYFHTSCATVGRTSPKVLRYFVAFRDISPSVCLVPTWPSLWIFYTGWHPIRWLWYIWFYILRMTSSQCVTFVRQLYSYLLIHSEIFLHGRGTRRIM